MTVLLKNNKTVELRQLQPGDAGKLFDYFNRLSVETRQRFGPHPFDRDTVERLCHHHHENELTFVAEEPGSFCIIAYAIIKKGYLLHDADRLSRYGLLLSGEIDCTFAPSVADAWQNSGLGSKLLEYILVYLRSMNFKRMILWGGVQCINERAVRYYQKFGFKILGEFEYNGENYDMIREL